MLLIKRLVLNLSSSDTSVQFVMRARKSDRALDEACIDAFIYRRATGLWVNADGSGDLVMLHDSHKDGAPITKIGTRNVLVSFHEGERWMRPVYGATIDFYIDDVAKGGKPCSPTD